MIKLWFVLWRWGEWAAIREEDSLVYEKSTADYLETLLKVFRLKKRCSKDEKHVTGALGIIRSNWEDIRSPFQTLLRESALDYKTHGKQVAATIMVIILILCIIQTVAMS